EVAGFERYSLRRDIEEGRDVQQSAHEIWLDRRFIVHEDSGFLSEHLPSNTKHRRPNSKDYGRLLQQLESKPQAHDLIAKALLNVEHDGLAIERLAAPFRVLEAGMRREAGGVEAVTVGVEALAPFALPDQRHTEVRIELRMVAVVSLRGLLVLLHGIVDPHQRGQEVAVVVMAFECRLQCDRLLE